jgi:hypothetical protein
MGGKEDDAPIAVIEAPFQPLGSRRLSGPMSAEATTERSWDVIIVGLLTTWVVAVKLDKGQCCCQTGLIDRMAKEAGRNPKGRADRITEIYC